MAGAPGAHELDVGELSMASEQGMQKADFEALVGLYERHIAREISPACLAETILAFFLCDIGDLLTVILRRKVSHLTLA